MWVLSFTQNIYADEVYELPNGNYLRVSPVSERIVRIQMNTHGHFPLTPMEKYGIVRTDWPDIKGSIQAGNKILALSTSAGKLEIDLNDGSFVLKSTTHGENLTKGNPITMQHNGGFGVRFDLTKDELFYGLGDTDREHIQHRGHLMRSWVSYGQAYAPAPFIMSSKGWALFLNTTYKHFYDVGKSDPDKLQIWSENGELDMFLITGDSYRELMYQYTEITGKPRLLPQKAYGLMFVENREVNQYELLEHARTFRALQIPCDYLGLEPGWMETFRDPTVDIKWDKEKFFMPSSFGDRFRKPEWAEKTFIGALNRSGFDLSIWTLCEYDITFEAERQAKKDFPHLDQKQKEEPLFPFDESNFDSRGHGQRFFNKNTKIDEPWFEHFKGFLGDGVRAVKQDPAYIINEHPDWHYGNGMNDDQMHNLFQPMYQRQVYDGWKDYLGERPMFYFCTGYAGVQHWAPTWAGDEGGRERPLTSMLNHSMTAHSNVSCDMDVFTPEGIHFGFFQGWSQVNSWWTIEYPWHLGDLGDVFADYARLRYRLMPYIYTNAHLSHQTAVPIMRAMPLMYPHDPACADLTKQYMFGEYLLVSAFTDTIYLPEGQWIDYWTREEYKGKQQLKLDLPVGKGGGLFVKAGAIIPEWPYVDHVGQRPMDTLGVQVYPYGKSSFSLIEDAGEGFGYENGETTTAQMHSDLQANSLEITLEKRQGSYQGMTAGRWYNLSIHLAEKPSEVVLDEKVVHQWEYSGDKNLLTIPAVAEGSTLIVKF